MRFCIDALSLTFRKGTALDLMDATERGFIGRTVWDEAGLSWTSKELDYNGWAAMHTYAGGDITIMEGKGFCCWQVKSRACEVCQENIPEWLGQAVEHGGATATRIDTCWSPVKWDPSEFLEHLRGPELVSSQRKHGAGWMDNDDGRTASLPPYSHRKGAPRFLRLYDARGYNRLEHQINKPDADSCLREFVGAEPDRWNEIALTYLLRTVDFRTGTQKIVTQRARSLWWGEFLGDLKKASSRPL